MSNKLKIVDVERIKLRVPYRERIQPWYDLQGYELHYVEITRVTTNSPDLVGYGETVPLDTWGVVTDEAMERVKGRNPADFLGDDSLGAGLQMAIYDLVGKSLEVPVHRLFSQPQVRNRVPISWWDLDMPPEVLAEEAKEALSRGFVSHKIKARPWHDIFAQVEAISAATPSYYHLDVDWNELLLNSGNAVPVLQALDRYERVSIFEGPIPAWDIEGYREIRNKVAHPLAIHYGEMPFPSAVRAAACDGFLVYIAGVAGMLRQGTICAAFQKPQWVQVIGTGLVTAMAAHIGSVLPLAQWPAVTCTICYEDDLIVEPLTVEGGTLQVPQGPGLGVTFDESVVERYKHEGPYTFPEKRPIVSVTWPGNRRVRYAGTGPVFWSHFVAGNYPVQERGSKLEMWPDDGSKEWAELYARLKQGPIWG